MAERSATAAGGTADPAAAAQLVERIDALLPQTQCTKCGYAGCRPYAEAIAAGAPINRCPPGGAAGIGRLAALLGRAALALDPDCGSEQPLRVAVIDEARCIGCTLCIAACPVDAIVGARRRMHDVLAAHCTGCELCVAPCPMDCIALLPAPRAWTTADADAARRRHRARNARLARRDAGVRAGPASAARIPAASAAAAGPAVATLAGERRQALVQAAIERARARRGTPA